MSVMKAANPKVSNRSVARQRGRVRYFIGLAANSYAQSRKSCKFPTKESGQQTPSARMIVKSSMITVFLSTTEKAHCRRCYQRKERM